VDGPLSVSKYGIKSLLHLQSLAYGSRLKIWAPGREVCIFTYPGGTPSVSKLWLLSLAPGGAGGVPGQHGASCGGGAPVPVRLQRVCGFITVPCWQGRQPSIWFSWTIAACLFIAGFISLFPGKSTPHYFSSRTSAWGFLISCCVSSIAACENPPFAILPIFKARCISECSSCTRPPCLAIVADMLNTYKLLVAASKLKSGYYLNCIRLCSLL